MSCQHNYLKHEAEMNPGVPSQSSSPSSMKSVDVEYLSATGSSNENSLRMHGHDCHYERNAMEKMKNCSSPNPALDHFHINNLKIPVFCRRWNTLN